MIKPMLDYVGLCRNLTGMIFSGCRATAFADFGWKQEAAMMHDSACFALVCAV